MASGYSDAEQKINLSVLQQKDPYITGIADSASQVAAYSFNAALNEWEKTNIEGTLFVYTRSAFPLNGFMIINRLHLNDLIEPINKNLEFQLQDPFLLYKNSQSAIYGIWFYDRDECARIGQLMNSLVQVATDTQNQENGRQRRASESDTTSDRLPVVMETSMCSPQKNNVDILQMLSKAQDEYDKGTAACSSPSKRANGASPSDSKHYAAYNGITLGQLGSSGHQPNATTHINLDALFRKASLQNEKTFNDQKLANMKSAFHMPLIPLTNQATPTVEEIERAQRESTAANAGAPLGLVSSIDVKSAIVGIPSSMGGYHHQPLYVQHHQLPDGENPVAPESPNTALRRTLKIVPPSSVASGIPGRPFSVATKDSGFASKQQATVVQTLFSQQSGRLSSQGIPPRTSISSLFGGSHAGVQKSNFSSDEATGGHQWVGLECQPSEKPPERCTPVTREIYGRQTSIEGLAKPDTFLANAIKNSDHGVTSTMTTLLSPMAFQTPGKLAKCKSLVSESSEVTNHQNVSSSLKEASNLITNHIIRSPYTECQAIIEPIVLPISPLNKDQLRQALINLLKTDNSFIASIHEAYTASLNNELINRHRSRGNDHY